MNLHRRLLADFAAKLDRLRGRSAPEAVRMVWRKLVYRRVLLGRYEVAAGASIPPLEASPLRIDFLRSPDFDRIAGTSPYLTGVDLERLRSNDAVCIVARDGATIAASSWMTRGDVYVTELQRFIRVPPGEHFSCRGYVDPTYRGKSLLSHMIHAYSVDVAAPDDRVWCLIYAWNLASIRSYTKIGWQCTGEMGTITVFGIQFPIEQSQARAPSAGAGSTSR